MKSYEIDRQKKFMVVDKGQKRRIVSKHISFYLAQCAVERHLKNGRITNNYEILPIKD